MVDDSQGSEPERKARVMVIDKEVFDSFCRELHFTKDVVFFVIPFSGRLVDNPDLYDTDFGGYIGTVVGPNEG